MVPRLPRDAPSAPGQISERRLLAGDEAAGQGVGRELDAVARSSSSPATGEVRGEGRATEREEADEEGGARRVRLGARPHWLR